MIERTLDDIKECLSEHSGSPAVWVQPFQTFRTSAASEEERSPMEVADRFRAVEGVAVIDWWLVVWDGPVICSRHPLAADWSVKNSIRKQCD